MRILWMTGAVAAMGCHPSDTTETTSITVTLDTSETGSTTEPETSTSPVTTSVGTTEWETEELGLVSARLHPSIRSLIYVSFVLEEAGTVEASYSFDEGKWGQAPAKHSQAGEVEVILLGIPFDHGATLNINATLDSGEVLSAEGLMVYTGAHPEGLPQPTLLLSKPERLAEEGIYLIGSVNQDAVGWSGGTYWRVILDRQGRIVWAQKTPDQKWSIYARISTDGDDLLWDQASWWADYDLGEQSVVYRTKIDGTVIEEIATPGLHHAFTELPDETIVWGDAYSWGSERLVKRSGAGEIETIWDCDVLGDAHSCQSNTLYYHQESDRFLFSFYTSNSAVEIDHKSGEVTKLWGALNGAWAFEPVDYQFLWQHGLNYLANGNLLLSSKSNYSPTETLAIEYEVDADSETLTKVWSFGEGEGIFGSTAGEAHRLSNGNTLHNYGSGGRVREITEDGVLVWDLDFGANRLVGRTVFTDNLYRFAP